MRLFSYVILLILLLLGITFACLNHNAVTINYFIGQNQVALSLLLVIAFAVGGVLGLLISTAALIKLKADVRKLKRQLKKEEKL